MKMLLADTSNQHNHQPLALTSFSWAAFGVAILLVVTSYRPLLLAMRCGSMKRSIVIWKADVGWHTAGLVWRQRTFDVKFL